MLSRTTLDCPVGPDELEGGWSSFGHCFHTSEIKLLCYADNFTTTRQLSSAGPWAWKDPSESLWHEPSPAEDLTQLDSDLAAAFCLELLKPIYLISCVLLMFPTSSAPSITPSSECGWRRYWLRTYLVIISMNTRFCLNNGSDSNNGSETHSDAGLFSSLIWEMVLHQMWWKLAWGRSGGVGLTLQQNLQSAGL